MKRFRLFAGNRLETLAADLADTLRRPLSHPLAPEIVVVQSAGMARWISMALARRHGICANMAFPFPNDFIDSDVFRSDAFRAVLTDLPEQSPFDRPVMAWTLMAVLPACLENPEFAPLRRYLDGGDTDLRLFQIAQRIADLFDQYLTFRPEWILDWEAGRGDGWQPALWRKIAGGRSARHRAALGRSLTAVLAQAPLSAASLPERISVFGISSLPRFHMEILDALSRHVEVNLFLMNPCADFWGDTLSRGELRRVVRKARERSVAEADLHLRGQNTLLASLGILGRDFFDMITEFDPEVVDTYQDPGRETLLSAIQSDILNRIDRPSEGFPRLPLDPEDRSLSVHACHSPMREAEVLFDHLLDLFAADATLRPGDILIMAPDIEAYAPYIQAVFDRPAGDPKHIPYSIADRGIRGESRLIEAFMGLLDLADGRLGAPQVTALLETPWVRRKFGIAEADTGRIHRWIRDVRIRWGIDGTSRAALGLPDIADHTWRAGLDRLLMGYAMAGRGCRTFDGILPHDPMEGSETDALGGLLEFTDRLFSHVENLSIPRTPAAWAGFLTGVVDAFFEIDAASEKDVEIISDAVAELAETADRAGFDRTVDLRVIQACLDARLGRDVFGFGFITGGVTFCAMLPMRSIPFRVIGLLGMNSADYPRNTRTPGFDLMAARPRPGDRSRRKDDRYLFLEALLSAREKLYISHVGQSIRDNSPIPPSVLVSELLDAVERGFTLPGGGRIEGRLVTHHRLQAFSPAYFSGAAGPLFSYSEENLEIARRLADGPADPPPFISAGLPEPDASWKTVELERLCRFFGNPHKYLLNHRLGVYLDEKELSIEEKEPFGIAGLEGYLLAENLVENRLSGRAPGALFSLKRSAGDLPHGRVGEALYESISAGAEVFFGKISPLVGPPAAPPVEMGLRIGEFTLTGRIANLHGDHRVQYRCTQIKAGDQVNAWIRHLALNAAEGPHPRRSVIAGTDRVWEFSPIEEAPAHLARLLALYREGLQRPLPFFPRSSLAFAEQRMDPEKPVEAALRAAWKEWLGYKDKGEGEDSYRRRCTGGGDPFDGPFQETALSVFTPLLRHRRKIG
ncbi:exodeoxyribonuclease V subunit gamma [Desulfococcus sp.]|uniref:exodeoxyribonuclease V subunit gamma n=1 Tax=Desulfococcus sp. TaxID=2025834 RepID=UPI003593DC59